jgi:hypothetical protein
MEQRNNEPRVISHLTIVVCGAVVVVVLPFGGSKLKRE